MDSVNGSFFKHFSQKDTTDNHNYDKMTHYK